MRRLVLVLAAATALAAPATSAWAWGASGHRIIGQMAAKNLPAEVPAFLRSKAGVEALGELAREPDRSYAAGKAHDTDRDPGHFADVDDNERMLGGVKLSELPATRPEYEDAQRKFNTTNWKAGYLPYAMIDAWQQLVKDFNIYRAVTLAEKTTKDSAKRRFYRDDLKRREALIMRDLGYLAHFVGDGSQPLHVSDHFNGWGPGPNPENFTQERIHAPFEGERAPALADLDRIQALIPGVQTCDCTDPTPGVISYLAVTNEELEPLYRLWKVNAFKDQGTPQGVEYVNVRLAAGATKLRDLAVDAWRASEKMRFGYRPDMTLDEIASGKADPWPSIWGRD